MVYLFLGGGGDFFLKSCGMAILKNASKGVFSMTPQWGGGGEWNGPLIPCLKEIVKVLSTFFCS